MIPKEPLSWEEIKQHFTDEWLLLTDLELDAKEESNTVKRARVVAHHKDFQKIYELHQGISPEHTACAYSGWELAKLSYRPGEVSTN